MYDVKQADFTLKTKIISCKDELAVLNLCCHRALRVSVQNQCYEQRICLPDGRFRKKRPNSSTKRNEAKQIRFLSINHDVFLTSVEKMKVSFRRKLTVRFLHGTPLKIFF